MRKPSRFEPLPDCPASRPSGMRSEGSVLVKRRPPPKVWLLSQIPRRVIAVAVGTFLIAIIERRGFE
jgi:hypothetical protein